MMMEWIPYMITAIGSGGLVGIVNVVLNRRKQAAEANDVEIKSSVIINKEWQNLYSQLKTDFDNFKQVTEKRSDERDHELHTLKKEFIEISRKLEECKKSINLQINENENNN